MSAEIPLPSEIPASQFVDGFQIPDIFSADCVRSTIQYKPRDDDVFIVTYPKCGTTWTQQIMVLLFRQGKPIETQLEFFAASPYLELSGAEAASETMPRPGAVKVHLPFRLCPWSDQAKYIYVARNPKDCCVSYYHHMKDMPGFAFNGTFDQFFELFISGKIDYEDYFDHLMGWYEHRNDPNVLFITFEEMKENPEASVLKLAAFIGEEKYATPLREDPEKLQNILRFSSFKYMKEKFNAGMDELVDMPEEKVMNSKLTDAMKKLLTMKPPKELVVEKPPPSQFIRKGINEDWKNYFNEDQSRRMDQKFAERTKGTDLPDLWKKYMS